MKKKLLFIMIIVIIFSLTTGCGNKNKDNKKEIDNKDEKIEASVDIIDINSKTRPLAVAVNNTPVAINAQQGLNSAYLIYEIPTEGYTSRLLAFFKDVPNTKVGTIRSARHNFIDYAYESDAIFVAFGWSHYAEDEMKSGIVNYVEGIVGEGGMYRENPLGLDYEHTVYMETDTVRNYAVNNKGYNNESDNTILLNYSGEDVDLSKKEGSSIANKVNVDYGDIYNEFIYDSDNKVYKRVVNGEERHDLATKEVFTTKNIIVQKISYQMCSDNHYWDLNTTGSGDGYYITNGYYVPIKWNKDSRNSKTIYKYLNGEEIEVSDGRTYIEVQINQKDTSIE